MPVRTIKRRYIAFRVKNSYNFSKNEIRDTLTSSILKRREFSELRKRGPRLIDYDKRYGAGIIRCGHRDLNEVKSSLINIDKISGKDVTMRVIGVSGTIKALRRKFLTKLEAPAAS